MPLSKSIVIGPRWRLHEDERQRLILEKGTHLEAAVQQRRFVSKFVKEFVRQHAPIQEIPSTIIPDHYDDERSDDRVNNDIFSLVQV